MPIISGKYGFCFVCNERSVYCEDICDMCKKRIYFCRKHQYEADILFESKVLTAHTVRLGHFCDECSKTIPNEEIEYITNLSKELQEKIKQFKSKYSEIARSRL